jgi:hypothetical protein
MEFFDVRFYAFIAYVRDRNRFNYVGKRPLNQKKGKKSWQNKCLIHICTFPAKLLAWDPISLKSCPSFA